LVFGVRMYTYIKSLPYAIPYPCPPTRLVTLYWGESQHFCRQYLYFIHVLYAIGIYYWHFLPH